METVDIELVRKIFLHIDRTEKQAELLPDRQKWNKLTSALYTLEDSSCAIEYYIETAYPADVRGKYLFTYGLFQAIILQQDSIKSINKALFNKGIDFKKEYPDAYKARELRNDTTGHPTDRSGDKKFISLAQISMEKYSFYYCKDDYKDSKEDSIIDVNVEKAISDTAKCVNDILKKAVDDLDKEFKEYIEKHRDRKMVDIFNNLHYAEEKALLDEFMQSWGYNATKEMVTKCEEELKERYGSVEAVDSFKFLLDDIHALHVLIDDIYDICTERQERVRYYLVELLFVKLHELEDYCRETDEYFENYGETVIDNKSEGITINIISPDGCKVDKKSLE